MAVYTGGAPARGCYTSAIYATVRRRWRWLRPVCRSSRRRADAEFPEREREERKRLSASARKKRTMMRSERSRCSSYRLGEGREERNGRRRREREKVDTVCCVSLSRSPSSPDGIPWLSAAAVAAAGNGDAQRRPRAGLLLLLLRSLSLSIPAHEHRFIHADTRRAQTQLARAHQTTARIPVCVARIFGIDVVAARTPVECRAGWETGPDYPADIIRSGDAAALACTWNKCEYRFFEFYSIPV